jgi:tetratricopeptide (TPR) repeat protein
MKLGRHYDALKCYDKVLTINPNDDEVLYNKGLALTKLERYQEAWNLAISHRDSRKS